MKKMFINTFTKFNSSIKKSTIALILLWLVLLPFTIALALFGIIFAIISYIIIAPFKYPKYIKSHYYKIFKKKYDLSISNSLEYSFYNYSISNMLDIEFVSDINGNAIYMKKNNAIYVFDCITHLWFDDETCLYYDIDDMKDIKISDYILENYGNHKLPIKLVMNEKSIGKKYLNQASKCEYLYVYKDLNDLRKL